MPSFVRRNFKTNRKFRYQKNNTVKWYPTYFFSNFFKKTRKSMNKEYKISVWSQSSRCNSLLEKEIKNFNKDNCRLISNSKISLISLKFMRDVYITKWSNILTFLLSRYQWGFRKGYNLQHYLVTLIEKWRESVDKGGWCF